jgi:hypothetical protein
MFAVGPGSVRICFALGMLFLLWVHHHTFGPVLWGNGDWDDPERMELDWASIRLIEKSNPRPPDFRQDIPHIHHSLMLGLAIGPHHQRWEIMDPDHQSRQKPLQLRELPITRIRRDDNLVLPRVQHNPPRLLHVQHH